jgi:NTP pyrophosphatase (non-canonical NTP hydrolase)
MDKPRTILDIAKDDVALLERKQDDYANAGDPYLNFREAAEFVNKARGTSINALDGAYYLLGLKVSRLKNLGKRKPKNEPKVDTLQDLRGYSDIIQAMEEEEVWVEKNTLDSAVEVNPVMDILLDIRDSLGNISDMLATTRLQDEANLILPDEWDGYGEPHECGPQCELWDGESNIVRPKEYETEEHAPESIPVVPEPDDDPIVVDDAIADDVYGLNNLASRIHDTARAKGWWNGVNGKDWEHVIGVVGAKLLLVHSELSEATEDLRVAQGEDDLVLTSPGDDGKPVGFATELADVLIRILDLSAWLDIDIEDAVAEKMLYNAKRSYRHGDKNL